MKIKIILFSLFFLTLGASLLAQDSNLNFKGGLQFPDSPNKAGFDSAVSYNYGVDRYFTIGAEAGFGWVKFKDEGEITKIDGVELASVDKINIYSFPMMAVGTIRLFDMQQQYGFMPYLTGGVGYSWAKLDNPDLDPDFDDRFDGFTWQISGGLKVNLGESSNLTFLVEGGWRSSELENKDKIMLNMSGFIARAGLSFPLTSEY